ncbi:MAG: D-alanyl-D-alanine carboxypeptidase/D-alanyl-D-alanine-endopeptidase [Armatimonadetes bacterium]|jgi:D-alanyl-D-alanine carboxypeptidase/D-alanyl-D-alanine-endopeptidase (penicillin-binding protein 4)|nr:D-alanyl-D-alanine carboxypeptidase/D-alanyl-D-alanine-endopeptidase [Armatimonadota bacterium]
MLKLRRFLTFLILCAILATCSQAASLTESIDAILNDPALKYGAQGVAVRSIKTGQTLYQRNADALMIPASNFKLLVSATILELLGPDFTFETRVFTTGKLINGILDGDLIIKGGGDPVLRTSNLTDLAKQVKATGINVIKGDIIADDTLFDRQRLASGWSWDSLQYYYSAEVSALNLNRNTVDVFVYPGKEVGDEAEVKLAPETSYFTIESSATTGAPDSSNTIWVSRTLGQNHIRVSGSIAKGTKVTSRETLRSVMEPQLYAAHAFAGELAKQNVKFSGKIVSAKQPEEAKLVAIHKSPSLSTILSLLNKPSDNLIADVLLKYLGAHAKGLGSFGNGADVEREFFKRIGMDLDGISISDGSGLSRFDYISANNLIVLLSYMHSSEHSKVYIESLPIAGVDGSLYSRMRNTSAKGNVHAKTGYIGRVSSLSGYVNTKSGEPLVFSIIMNHHLCPKSDATRLQDKICVLLADLP